MMSKPSKCRRFLLGALCVTAVAHGAGVDSSRANDFQDITQLEEVAKSAAQRLFPDLTDKQRLQVGAIQPKLQLARCDTPVKADRAPGIQVPGRALIELRCEGRAAWHIYVAAKVVGTTQVVLAAHALVVGTVLSAKDLTVEQRDMVGLPPGYLDDPSVAIGLTASRAVAGGAIVTNQELLGTQAVQRGQNVTLIANAGGISVRMAGRALGDGLVNQRVKVENLSSGKIVEGVARSAQVVEIIF
jgi:flagellar basal body P-ring formation protein FlgA